MLESSALFGRKAQLDSHDHVIPSPSHSIDDRCTSADQSTTRNSVLQNVKLNVNNMKPKKNSDVQHGKLTDKNLELRKKSEIGRGNIT